MLVYSNEMAPPPVNPGSDAEPADLEPISVARVCFLEATPVDRQRFLTCVRILRRYMEEQGAAAGKQSVDV